MRRSASSGRSISFGTRCIAASISVLILSSCTAKKIRVPLLPQSISDERFLTLTAGTCLGKITLHTSDEIRVSVWCGNGAAIGKVRAEDTKLLSAEGLLYRSLTFLPFEESFDN